MVTLNKHFFYNVTRKVITQFCDIFNNLSIARYDNVGRVLKFVRVPVKFAPKTKQWYWNELKNNQDRRDSIFPMMSVSMEGMEYSSDRQVNRQAKITSFTDGISNKRFYNPVPYDYTFKVLIVSQYLVDALQIVEQILPHFTPEAYIRITVPELNITGLSKTESTDIDVVELRVLYEGSTKNTPVELDEEAYRVITWEMTFKVQGYLFSPLYTNGISGKEKTIQKIVQNYYMSEESWSKRGQDNQDMTVSDIRMYSIPFSGSYNYPLTVELRSFDEVTDIHYSTDNIDFFVYETPLTLDVPTTIYYYGVNTSTNTSSPIYSSEFV